MANFLSEVERFLSDTGIAATTFGGNVMADPNFIRQLREGRSPRLTTVEKVEGEMARIRRDLEWAKARATKKRQSAKPKRARA